MLASSKPTILVVDDEPYVRELVSIYLEASGFTVRSAENGRQALGIVTESEIIVDILLTDIIMPVMNGRELANRISSVKPQIKVLFMSAYSADFLVGQSLCPEGSDYIRKPFSKEALLERVAKVWASGPKWKELVSKQF